MKSMYIPEGTIVKHDTIETDTLIVDGRLIVEGVIRAKRIIGKGYIIAKKIITRSVKADIVDVDALFTDKLIVRQLFCYTAKVNGSMIVTDYIEAQNVIANRVSVTLTNAVQIEAGEIIRLSPKKRSLAGMIFFSWLKSHFAFSQHKRAVNKVESKAIEGKETISKEELEMQRLFDSYKVKCKEGYRLILEPADKKMRAV